MAQSVDIVIFLKTKLGKENNKKDFNYRLVTIRFFDSNSWTLVSTKTILLNLVLSSVLE